MDDLKDKVAVVTGAASGIGLALAMRFATEGMRVVMADVDTAALAEAVQKVGTRALRAEVDVREPNQMIELAQRAMGQFGEIHIVSNNAGVGLFGLIHEVPLEDWQWIFNVNVWGVINGIHAFLPVLLGQDHGHIVNTASINGFVAEAFTGAYSASKAAIISITETLAAELAMQGSAVKASVLCPGPVRTRILSTVDDRLDKNHTDTNDILRRNAISDIIKLGQSRSAENEMDPAEVADRALAGIQANKLHIFTHEHLAPELQQRMQSVFGPSQPTWMQE
jgi:NAD(P)-dependent dehydrogenase (short-subunit alcohol dehydrogenase family)